MIRATAQSRFWAVLVFSGVPVFAATFPEPHLELSAYNQAKVESSVWNAAAEIVISVFREVGTSLVWSNCPGPACPERFGPTSLVVKVNRRENMPPMNWPNGACGVALASADSGVYAFIDYGCVVASGRTAGVGSILGHAIAHEIGHLLLGGRSHSTAGLMKKRWGVAEHTLMQQRRLSFQLQEAEQIRSSLRRRLAR
jgi:hypothetical protein